MTDNPIQINPLDFEDNVSIGFQLPLTNNNDNIFNLNYYTFDQIKTNLKNLLLTETGERWMLPSYGCGLKKKLFQPKTNNLQGEIDDIIRTSVKTWMPYITIQDLIIDMSTEHQVYIKIQFNVSDNIEQTDTLELVIVK